MPCYDEEMVGFGFSFLSFALWNIFGNLRISLYSFYHSILFMQLLDLIFQCWLVSEDPGTKKWLLVNKDSSWSTGKKEESFWFFCVFVCLFGFV